MAGPIPANSAIKFMDDIDDDTQEPVPDDDFPPGTARVYGKDGVSIVVINESDGDTISFRYELHLD